MAHHFLIAVMTILVCGLQGLSAQVAFAKDKLYNIFACNSPEKVIAYQPKAINPKLDTYRTQNKFQQWSITGLSGSFRLINPFENQALHVRTDNSMGITENNGSDESQLWTIKKVGDAYQIFPTNSPEMILTYNSEGELVLLSKKKAAKSLETLFHIKESRMAVPESMLYNLTDRPKVYWEDETCFAENKEIGHATYMPYPSEKAMLDDRHFYDTPWVETKAKTSILLMVTGNSISFQNPHNAPQIFIKKIMMYQVGKPSLFHPTGKCRDTTGLSMLT